MSSKNFDAYSAYYDLLYAGKDYAGEAAFVDELIRQYAPGSRALLDLGCGTGIHDWELAQRGYSVVGIDQSETMLEVARTRAQEYPLVRDKPQFIRGNLTSFTTQPVDVIVSLFDVISYLPDYTSMRSTATHIAASLKPGGLLIFDCWYGPAVHAQQPGTRVRKLESDEIALTRIATSDFDFRHNRIDVNYDMFVRWKTSDRIDAFSELHPMRCYFEDELALLLQPFGLKMAFAMEWFTRAAPSQKTWSVLFGFQREVAP
jgi:SAM-dependent methyltransferase